MTIPGRGDLVPRRRKRRTGRNVIALVVVLALAAAGYEGYQHFKGGSTSTVTTLPPCPKPTAVGPAAPRTVHVAVLNGTLTSGLAAQVAKALRHRGFHVASVGNTRKLVKTGVVVVSYGPGRYLAAQAVAEEFPHATVVKGNAAGVQLAIGPAFSTLASKSAVAAARAQFSRAAASASPTPTPTANCRPAA